MKKDLLCGTILLAVTVVFWTQRDGRGELVAAFPDFVLVLLALFGIGVIARAVLRRDGGAEPAGKVDLRFLAAAIVLLLLWALGMGLIGFTISSVLAFVVVAQMIRRDRPRPRLLITDTAVAVVVVVGVFFIFTRVLLVPLPVSVLIGM